MLISKAKLNRGQGVLDLEKNVDVLRQPKRGRNILQLNGIEGDLGGLAVERKITS